jgi:hypothetical protein
VHPCGGWSIGPVPTVYDPLFAWPTEPFSWKTFHTTATIGFVELTVPDEWATYWLPNLPYTFIGSDLRLLLDEIVAAALTDNTDIGTTNAKNFLADLGFSTHEELVDISSRLPDIFWACSPGLQADVFGTEEAAALAGYLP